MLLLLLSSPMCPGGRHGGQRHVGLSEDDVVLVDNAITAVQVLPELVVFPDWWGELVFEL